MAETTNTPDGAGGTPVVTDTGAPAPTPPAGTPWYGTDAETGGWLKNKGWAELPVDQAAVQLVRAHREAERFIGAPPAEIVRLAKPEDEVGTNSMWTKLGRPETAEKYDFAGVKHSDGSDLKPDEATALKNLAFSNNLTQSQAVGLVSSRVKEVDGSTSEAAAVNTAKLAEQQQALKTNWGTNFEANKFLASSTAQKLGVTPEQVATLEGVIGYDKVMEMFRTIGTKIGEAPFLMNQNPNVPGIMSQDQAASRVTELKNDRVWVDKYMNGDAAATREMSALMKILVGDDTAASRAM